MVDGTGTTQREYIYWGNQQIAFIANGATYYIHNDHLNTPQVITNQSQQVVWMAHYEPFGKLAANQSNSIELFSRFPGQYVDPETGLYYNYFRDYDPSIGRYIESDPIGLEGGVNTYAYVSGNPIKYYDPSGLVEVGNCNINIYTGKWSCSATVGDESNSCSIDTKGVVACSGQRGPAMCTFTYDTKTKQSDWDVKPVLPGIVDAAKTSYELTKVGAELLADRIEAGMQNIMDQHNQKIDDASCGCK